MLQLVPGGFLKAGDEGLFSSVNITDEATGYQIDGASVMWTGDAVNYNIFLGEGVFASVEGQYNVGIGYQAGYNCDGSNINMYMGYRAGYGAVAGNTGDENVGIGCNTLRYNSSGYRNVAMGTSALGKNTIGNYNFGLGAQALYANTLGSNNVAIGYSTLYWVGNSLSNVSIGYASGGYGAGSLQGFISYNTMIGHQSGNHILTGSHRNLFMGANSGYNATTGSDNVFLGHKSGYNQTINSNRLIIDNQDRGSAANEATMALIYGLFAAAPADQYLTFNANVGIRTTTPTGQLHIVQPDALGAKPVLILEQDDADETFVDFRGTFAFDGGMSISLDTTEDSAKFGAIRVEINAETKWIRVYDDHS